MGGLEMKTLKCLEVTQSRYSDQSIPCGTYQGGAVQLCDNCYDQAKIDYPQGWIGYPGDICSHGVYIGGCGADLMCESCELGE